LSKPGVPVGTPAAVAQRAPYYDLIHNEASVDAMVEVEAKIRKIIGASIKRSRERCRPRWSQAKLAHMLNQATEFRFTTSAHYVSRWERGERKPGYEWGPVIERVLGLDLAAIEATARADLGVAASEVAAELGDTQCAEVPALALDEGSMASATGSDEVNRRQLLMGLAAVTALESARRGLARVVAEPEQADLDEWEAIAAEYGHSYLVISPEILIHQLSIDMPAARALIGASPARLRPGYCRVASELAVITARTWSSLEEYRQAWRWWRTARVLADASGDLATRMMCRGEEVVMGLYEHRPMSILFNLAAEAVALGGDTPTRGSVGLWAGIAQAHATIGRASDAVNALNHLERITDTLPSSITDAADSIYGWPEYRTRHTQSYVYTQLGDTSAAGGAQERALALYPETLPACRAQVELHRARCMVLDHDVRGGLAHATQIIGDLPDGFQRDAMVLSVGRKVLDTVPRSQWSQPEARVLLDALRC